MAQLKRGGKQTLEYLLSDLAAIDHYAFDNPAAVRRLTQRIRDRLDEEIKPLLERANPPLETRVRALEERLEQLTAGNVTRFRKAE